MDSNANSDGLAKSVESWKIERSSKGLQDEVNPKFYVGRWIFLLALLAVGFIEVWCRLGLYGDGAYLFWTDLQTHGSNLVPNFANARMIADIIPQLPLIAALHLGLTSVSMLSLIWSAGIVLVPLFMWILALKILWRNPLFWHLAVVAIAVEGTASFFAIGEYNFAYALVGLNVALLIDGLGTLSRRLGYIIVAVATIWSYPSMFFLGPVLIVLTLVLLARDLKLHELDRSKIAIHGIGILAYIASSVMAKYSIDHPNGSNVQGTSDILAPFRADVGQLRWTVLFLLLFIMATLFSRVRFLSIVPVLIVIWMVFAEPHNRILSQYDYRVVAGGFLVLGVGMLVLAVLSPARDHEPRVWLLIGVAIFGLYNFIPLVHASFGYHGWQDEVRGAIISRDAPVTFIRGVYTPASAKRIYRSPYRWSWGYSFLSVDLEPNRRTSMILDRGVAPGKDTIYGFTSDVLPAPFAYDYTQ